MHSDPHRDVLTQCLNADECIEWLRLTSPAVKHLSFIRLQGVISTVILETQAAWNLPSTTASTVAVAQLPCRLDRAATRPGVQVRQ